MGFYLKGNHKINYFLDSRFSFFKQTNKNLYLEKGYWVSLQRDGHFFLLEYDVYIIFCGHLKREVKEIKKIFKCLFVVKINFNLITSFVVLRLKKKNFFLLVWMKKKVLSGSFLAVAVTSTCLAYIFKKNKMKKKKKNPLL